MPLSRVGFSHRDQDRAELAGSREQLEKTAEGRDQSRWNSGGILNWTLYVFSVLSRLFPLLHNAHYATGFNYLQ